MRVRTFGFVILGILVGGLASPLLRWSSSAPRASFAAEEDTQAERASVLVETDKDRYETGQVIRIQVSNRLDGPVTTRDQRSFCTIIDLEREVEGDDEWEEIRNCISGAPVREVILEPGSSHTVKLAVGPVPPEPLVSGRYRATLVYSHGKRFLLAEEASHVARSATFHIAQTGG